MPARRGVVRLARALGPIGWLGPSGRLGLAVGWASLGRVAGWLLTALINKDIFTSSLKDDDGDGASKKSRGYSQIHIYFSLFKVFRYPNATELGHLVDLNFDLDKTLQNICQKTIL